MPIFHDHYETPPRRPASQRSATSEPQRAGNRGDGFGRTLLDGVHSGNAVGPTPDSEKDAAILASGRKMPVLNRVELIERIKRGNSPAWQQVPNVSISSSCPSMRNPC